MNFSGLMALSYNVWQLMDIPMLLFLRAGRWVVCAFIAFVLIGAGVIHMVKLHFTFALLVDNSREYLLHCAAGVLFGWIAAEALFAYARGWLTDLRRNFLPGPALACIAPIIFLVVLHQTRYFLNDGPATLAMAAGVLASGLFGGRSALPGIDIPDSFLTIIETGKMDGDFSIGIVNSLQAMDPYSPRLFSALAAIHHKRGNTRKAEFATRVADLLRNEIPKK